MLHTWTKGAAHHATRHVALCGSWRCDTCCRYRGRVDFARIADAFGPYEAKHVCFAVLTLDQEGTFSGEAWADAEAAYRALSDLAGRFMHRVNRMLAKAGLDEVGSRWVSTVECHRSGWPHLNIVMASRGLAELVAKSAQARAELGRTDRECKLVDGELLRHAIGAGWGPQCTLEVAHDTDAIAGYIVKLAGELDESFAALGEVTKMTQRPLQAPKGLRRIRSGRHFLPPRKRDPVLTGALLVRQDSPTGASVRVYGRATRAFAWDSAIERLKYLRREADLLIVMEREASASYIPVPSVTLAAWDSKINPSGTASKVQCSPSENAKRCASQSACSIRGSPSASFSATSTKCA